MASPRIAIIIYSMYGHIAKSTFSPSFAKKKKVADSDICILGFVVAESVKDGIVARGGNAEILQQVFNLIDQFSVFFFILIKIIFYFLFLTNRVPETLSDEVLMKMGAVKQDFPTTTRQTLTEYDAFLFGIPTRFGNMPAQMKVSLRCFIFILHSFYSFF